MMTTSIKISIVRSALNAFNMQERTPIFASQRSKNFLISSIILSESKAKKEKQELYYTNQKNVSIAHSLLDGSETPEFTDKHKQAILQIITTRQDKLKKSLNSFATSGRAYYIWRMARFHGGIDMRMPMSATWGISKESKEVKDQLDTFADEVAKKYLGSDMRAAMRWGRAFGVI